MLVSHLIFVVGLRERLFKVVHYSPSFLTNLYRHVDPSSTKQSIDIPHDLDLASGKKRRSGMDLASRAACTWAVTLCETTRAIEA